MQQTTSTCKGFFVTGTDTEIGKTLASSTLVFEFGRRGLRSIGMKPVAAGAELVEGEWRNEDVVMLTRASNIEVAAQLINPFLFRLPAAPHIAAARDRRVIELDSILDAYLELAQQAEVVVVEGVGGFRVPFNERHDSADLARTLGLPVILVVGMRLGCINHALLTAEAIAARGLRLAGWIANSAQMEMPHLGANIDALRERLGAPLLGSIPFMNQPDFTLAGRYLQLDVLLNKEG